MSNILTITGRELKSYFLSPIAYVITGVFAFFTGFLFYSTLLSSAQASLSGDFSWMLVLALIIVPALTMRLFAEENRMGTIELLMTAPVRDWEIVVGKYIAGMIAFIFLLVPTLWHVVIVARYGSPDYGPIATGYLGVLLVGAAFVGVGMFTSALTQNQFIAFMLGMITLLFLWFVNAPAGVLGSTSPLIDFLNSVALTGHFQDFFNGVIDSTHILFFVSLAVIAVFLTERVVESRRWR
jgi:gliding motility-associated transport system permease protein